VSEHEPHQFLSSFVRSNNMAHSIVIERDKRFEDKPFHVQCSCGSAGNFARVEDARSYATRHSVNTECPVKDLTVDQKEISPMVDAKGREIKLGDAVSFSGVVESFVGGQVVVKMDHPGKASFVNPLDLMVTSPAAAPAKYAGPERRIKSGVSPTGKERRGVPVTVAPVHPATPVVQPPAPKVP
jgi:hypothetical protein